MNDGMWDLCCNFPTFIQKVTTDYLTPDGGLILTKMNLVKSLPMVVLKVLDISFLLTPQNAHQTPQQLSLFNEAY